MNDSNKLLLLLLLFYFCNLSGKRNCSIALNEITLPNLAFLCEMPHNWTFFENYCKKYFIAYQETLLEHFVSYFLLILFIVGQQNCMYE
jgi:hypothetical protein